MDQEVGSGWVIGGEVEMVAVFEGLGDGFLAFAGLVGGLAFGCEVDVCEPESVFEGIGSGGIEEVAVCVLDGESAIVGRFVVIFFDFLLLVLGEVFEFLGGFECAEGKVAFDGVFHFGDFVFVSEQEDEVVLELSEVFVCAGIAEDITDAGGDFGCGVGGMGEGDGIVIHKE